MWISSGLNHVTLLGSIWLVGALLAGGQALFCVAMDALLHGETKRLDG